MDQDQIGQDDGDAEEADSVPNFASLLDAEGEEEGDEAEEEGEGVVHSEPEAVKRILERLEKNEFDTDAWVALLIAIQKLPIVQVG